MKVGIKIVLVSCLLSMLGIVCAHAQVRLLYAAPLGDPVDVETGVTLIFAHVQKIKGTSVSRVYVHYDDGTPTWADSNMIRTQEGSDYETYATIIASPSVKFCIAYEVNDSATGALTTYWDNNGGRDYNVSAWGTAGDAGVVGGNVGLVNVERYISSTTGFKMGIRGTIVATTDTSAKVKIRYTADDWTTYHDANASFECYDESGAFMISTYKFDIPNIASVSKTIRFAVCYTVGGVEYWDNNFTQNYNLSPAKKISWTHSP